MDDASSEPAIVSLDLLREITNGFTEERKLGSGSFGKVYLGVHQNGEKIAVKVLYTIPGLDHEQFQNELKNLSRLRHKNIVRLVGYCHDIQEEQVMYEGKLVLAQRTHRALCLEYMSNGSLDLYLSEECDRYDWHTCYRIIKGICLGLKYLHNELNPPIYHLDLKPANVLLDENMVPRIADFGISRLFSSEHTRATKSSLGTLGYTPPEFIRSNLISNKFDIFSLGVVIIKMMAGREGYSNSAEISSQEFTNHVQENWTNKLLETSHQRNAYSEQVKICIEIGLSCVHEDRHKRPTIQDIVYRLEETETKCTDAARKGWSLTLQGERFLTREADMETPPHYAQDPNDRHTVQIYGGRTINEFIEPVTPSSCLEQNPGPREANLDDDSQICRIEYQDLFAAGERMAPRDKEGRLHTLNLLGDPLPGVEKFGIVGEHRLGFTLRASGFHINGTTWGKFQWFRGSKYGTSMEPIEGATMDCYVPTADDLDSLLILGCIPMNDYGHQGCLVRAYSNKITSDPDMQKTISTSVALGKAEFRVFVKRDSHDQWENATLMFTRTRYQIYWDETLIDKKYSTDLKAIIPPGGSTTFSIVDYETKLHFDTIQEVTEPTIVYDYVRLRNIIVLAMRAFRKKALLDAT